MQKTSALQSYQTEFKDYLLNQTTTNEVFSVAVEISEKDQSYNSKDYVQKRLNIYKNNMYYSLLEALGSLYPVVRKIVGEGFFNNIARQYVLENPPLNPVISSYGEKFSMFIAGQKNCKALIYLADVAELEWRCQQAFNAKDDAVLKPEDLSHFDQEDLINLRFRLHSSAKFLCSKFPVDDIWHENLKPEVGEVSLQCQKNTYLLIYRQGLRVEVINLKQKVYLLLKSIADGNAIEDAWADVKYQVVVDDDELTGIFGYLLSLSVFSQAFFLETLQEVE